MINGVLTVLLMVATISAPANKSLKREFPTKGIKGINIHAAAGAIEVRRNDKLQAEVVDNDQPELCRISMENVDGTLTLTSESSKSLFTMGDGCRAGFRVNAPADLPLDVKTGSGGIRVMERDGDVRLYAGSGEIVLDGVKGAAVLGTGSGNISGTLSGSLTAKCGSGNVRLAWTKAPSENVDVKTGSGDVILAFPPGTKLRASQLSGSGSTVNDFGNSPDATLFVSVKTGSGDSKIEVARK